MKTLIQKTKTTDVFRDHSAVHQSGGNGWAVVEDPNIGDKRFCRIVLAHRDKLGSIQGGIQLFLAARDRLTVETVLRPDFPLKGERPTEKDYIPARISELVMDQLSELREGLASGKTMVQNTRIVPK